MGSVLEPTYEDTVVLGRQAVDVAASFGHRTDICLDNSAPPLHDPYWSPPEQPGDVAVELKEFTDAAHAGADPLSPYSLAHIPTGAVHLAAIGTYVAASANPYTGVASESPRLVAMEVETIRWVCTQFGLRAGAGGLITSGGSLANLTALIAARADRLGQAINGGTVYLTNQTHHSVHKAASVAAVQVREVPTTSDLRMDVEQAAAMIAEDQVAGLRPFAIVANAGSTATGVIDPLPQIAGLAERFDLWAHVDAAYGGAFQLVPRGRDRLTGIERFTSITVDPHKGWSQPNGAGLLLTPEPDRFQAAFTQAGAYLPEPSPDPAVPDFACLGLELTRPYRGLPLRLALVGYGLNALRSHLDEKLDLAADAYADLVRDSRFELPWQPDLSIVTFALRAGDHPRFLAGLAQLGLTRACSATIIDGRPMLRMCILSHRTHREHVDAVLTAFHQLAREHT